MGDKKYTVVIYEEKPPPRQPGLIDMLIEEALEAFGSFMELFESRERYQERLDKEFEKYNKK